jgi:hypothetical protein
MSFNFFFNSYASLKALLVRLRLVLDSTFFIKPNSCPQRYVLPIHHRSAVINRGRHCLSSSVYWQIRRDRRSLSVHGLIPTNERLPGRLISFRHSVFPWLATGTPMMDGQYCKITMALTKCFSLFQVTVFRRTDGARLQFAGYTKHIDDRLEYNAVLNLPLSARPADV